ncbi:hypothetical protein V8C35DRAFT_331885 [Trichoderma chlorosporum]
MGIVAIAGGTGSIGRALVEAIVSRGKHEVKILSREVNSTLAKEMAVPILTMDYSDTKRLQEILEENEIDTIISAIRTLPEEGVPSEVSIIRAAEASKTVRRFIPSNWAVPLNGDSIQRIPSTSVKAQAIDELVKSRLTYTSICGGFLLDYFCVKTTKTFMPPVVAVVDMRHNVAAIPDSGDTPVTFTHSFDVAKFTDRVLDLDTWDPEYFIVGDSVTWNTFVEIAEEAKGVKFKKIYDSIDDLKQGLVTELPSLTEALPHMPIPREVLLAFSAAFGLMFDDGTMNLDETNSLNKRFPDIKPLKVRDAIRAEAKAL